MENEVENQSIFQCLLELIFNAIFGGFMMGNWTQVGTNMDPISMCNAKSHVLKNLSFSLTKTILLKVLEVQVEI